MSLLVCKASLCRVEQSLTVVGDLKKMKKDAGKEKAKTKIKKRLLTKQ